MEEKDSEIKLGAIDDQEVPNFLNDKFLSNFVCSLRGWKQDGRKLQKQREPIFVQFSKTENITIQNWYKNAEMKKDVNIRYVGYSMKKGVNRQILFKIKQN